MATYLAAQVLIVAGVLLEDSQPRHPPPRTTDAVRAR